nr:TolC family protein [Thauera sp. K11]
MDLSSEDALPGRLGTACLCRAAGLRRFWLGLAAAGLVGGAQASGLPELISEAVSNHPSVRAGMTRSAAASDQVESARWQYYPTPSVSVDYAGHNSAATARKKPVGVFRLEQTLWAGGRLENGVAYAEARALSTQVATDETRQQLALDVVQGYAEWFAAELKLKATGASVATHGMFLEQISRRVDEGLSPLSDRTLALSRLEQVDAELAGYQAQAVAARVRLNSLLGHPVDDNRLRSLRTDPLDVALDPLCMSEEALRMSPSIRRAEAELQSLEAEARLADAALKPRLVASFEHQRGAYYDGDPDHATRIMVVLKTEFGAGLSSWSNRSAAYTRLQAEKEEIESLRLRTREQIERDIANLKSLRSREKTLAGAVTENEKLRESYDRQYLTGRKSWLEVMNVARESAQLENQLGDVRGALILTSWRLALLTRGVGEIVQGTETKPVCAQSSSPSGA